MDEKELNICIKKYKNNGDTFYFEKIYCHFLSKIYRYIFLKILDKETAEDLTSEVFIRVYKNLNKVNLNAITIKIWIYKIAKNLLTDHFRSSQNKQNVKSLDEYLEGDKELESIGSMLIDQGEIFSNDNQFKNEKLISALNSLPEMQREIIFLRYVEGMDFKSISLILNKSEIALRALKFRALENIKGKLINQVLG
ncbi:MAG: sigma-70 family RNA polymerase sigma factor [Actinomycetia bacterium]|nr:sigma-70 family RNA polymerase sigma factor [Actinomycetes bacterium]